MTTGTCTFRCNDCGHTFRAPGTECVATVFIAPAKCPQCGSHHTWPYMQALLYPMYKRIWKAMDEQGSERY